MYRPRISPVETFDRSVGAISVIREGGRTAPRPLRSGPNAADRPGKSYVFRRLRGEYDPRAGEAECPPGQTSRLHLRDPPRSDQAGPRHHRMPRLPPAEARGLRYRTAPRAA